MKPFKEKLLLNKLLQNEYSVSFVDQIPDDISLITKSWFDKNVSSIGKHLTLETFIIFYKETESEYLKTNYIESRQKLYPTVENQLDMLYWDMVNGTTKWKDTITEIKKKYPKL